MEPLDLSVVIATYDRPHLLREALASVLAQTVQPREIVVVVNGPGDFAAVLEEYRGRVTVLRMESAGVQAARNLGIRSTTTRWVALLDDDDLWSPSYLETVALVLADGRADLVYCDHRKFTTSPDGLRHDEPMTKAQRAPGGYWDGVPRPADGEAWSFVGGFPPERLLVWNPFFLSTTVVRRDLLDRIGLFDPSVPPGTPEDIEFLARALTHGRMAMIWEPLVLYRLHDANASRRDPSSEPVGRWEVFEYLHACGTAVDPGLAAALERWLPRQRGVVFDAAFAYSRPDVLARVVPLLRPEDWTVKRRIKRAALRLPLGPRRRAVALARRLNPGQPQDRALPPSDRRPPLPAYPADAPIRAAAPSRADSR